MPSTDSRVTTVRVPPVRINVTPLSVDANEGCAVTPAGKDSIGQCLQWRPTDRQNVVLAWLALIFARLVLATMGPAFKFIQSEYHVPPALSAFWYVAVSVY